MGIVLNVLEEGFLYGIMAMGVYVTYKILGFPDLSVEGSFPFGCCITAVLMLAGVPPVLALLFAFLAGAAAGCVTGLLHVKLGISDLLCGIIVMMGLWSVNLALLGGSSVLAFYDLPTIFTVNLPNRVRVLVILIIVALVVKLLMDFFFRTRTGLLLKSTGDNPSYVTGLGRDPGKMKILGLALGNGLTAMSGSLLAQQSGLANINSGVGLVAMTLAAVIIGTSIFGRMRLLKPTTAVLLGMLSYRACLSLALEILGSVFHVKNHTNYLKLVMAIIFTIVLVFSKKKEKSKKEGYPNASKL